MSTKDKIGEAAPDLILMSEYFQKWDEPGVMVVGRIASREPVQFAEGGESMRYVVKVSDDTVAFLAPSQLAPLLDDMPIGTYIKVVYTGRSGRTKTFALEAEKYVSRYKTVD